MVLLELKYGFAVVKSLVKELLNKKDIRSFLIMLMPKRVKFRKATARKNGR